MSLGLCLDPDHNAGDVCLCPTGCGGFSLLNRLIMANHERSRTYTAGIDSHHPAHISSLGPTVYCIALLTLEGHWLFCCITDLNLTFERPVEDTEVVTQKKKMAFLCPLTACGFLPTSLSRIQMLVVLWIVSVKASETPSDAFTRGQTELPTCVLYFSSLFQIVIVLPWHSQCCTALRSVVPLSGLSIWTGQARAKDGQKNVGFFFF